MPEPFPGWVVAGSYRLGSKIRSGRFGGSAWRGWTVDTQQRVTVVFPCNDDDERRIARRYLIIAAVQHPHLATPIDHGYYDDVPYIVYEGLEGETLATATPRGRFTVQEALRLAQQLLGALESAHGRGLVHGALDGDCVFLVQRAHGGLSPKILGFGLDAGDGSDLQGDVAAAAGSLAAIFEQIEAADTFDAPVPDGLIALLGTARDREDPALADAGDLRAAIEDLVERQRRPRTGRDARVLMSTAPSMKRAMHDVLLQTSEHAAVPLDLSRPPEHGSRPQEHGAEARPRTLGPEPLVPDVPVVRVEVAPITAATAEASAAEPPAAEPSAAESPTTAAEASAPKPESALPSATASTPAPDEAPGDDAATAAPARAADDTRDPGSRRRPSQEWAAPDLQELGRTGPERRSPVIDRSGSASAPSRPSPRSPEHAGRGYAVTRPERPHPHPGPAPAPGTRSDVGVPAPTIETPAAHGRTESAPRPAARPRSRATSWIAAAIFAALVLVMVFGLTREDSTPRHPAPPAPPAPSAGPAPLAASEEHGPVPGAVGIEDEPGPGAGEVTRLTLRTTPTHAVVRYQGSVLGETPIELEVPEGSHRFDLSLPGYRPLSVNVEGRGSQALTHDLVLTPLPDARAPEGPATEAAPTPPGPEPRAPGGPTGSGPSPAPRGR